MEEASILQLTLCGFIKVAAYELVESKCTLDERILQVHTMFDYEIRTETVTRNFPKIVDSVKKSGKQKKEERTEFFPHFQ